jgi:hypothetical protein
MPTTLDNELIHGTSEPLSAARCRACKGGHLRDVISYGVLPVADLLIDEEHLGQSDPQAPLDVVFCEACALLQLRQCVAPAAIYADDYPYYSSLVPGLCERVLTSAARLAERLHLGADDLVMEIASNDGYLLKAFVESGIPVLGIDPARGPAEAARRAGVPTICEFFSLPLARQLRQEGRRVSLLLANNTLNIIPDVEDCVAGMRELLEDGGTGVLEVPYVVDLIDHCLFDNIVHQNTAYFSLTALDRLFRGHGLFINDVEHEPDLMGGSVRVFVEFRQSPTDAILAALHEEDARGVGRMGYYGGFARRVRRSTRMLREMLLQIKGRGERIVAYGAAGGMATTLLNLVGADTSLIEYAVDINSHKHGRYTPGTRLKILPTSRLVEDRPDYALLLAWNYADEVLAQQAAYRAMGGKFIIPVPEPHVV